MDSTRARLQSTMAVDADRVASVAFEQYELLPANGKPRFDNEHTCLAALVVVEPASDSYSLLALTTGSKVTPASAVRSDGASLVDCHAEVLARRALRRVLMRQVELLRSADTGVANDPLFLLKAKADGKVERISERLLVLYVSTSPCGDCSVSESRVNRSVVHPNGETIGMLRVF